MTCTGGLLPQLRKPAGKTASLRRPDGSISDRTASILCYIPVFGVIPAIIFLAVQKYRTNPRVRFDAFQSLYLFVAFLVVSVVLPAFLWLSFRHDRDSTACFSRC